MGISTIRPDGTHSYELVVFCVELFRSHAASDVLIVRVYKLVKTGHLHVSTLFLSNPKLLVVS